MYSKVLKECRFTRSNSTKCRSTLVLKDGSGMCWWHSPKISEDVRRQARCRGGRAKRYIPIAERDFRKNITSDLKLVLVDTINQLRKGDMPPNVGNALVYACTALNKLYESQELAKQVQELEKIIKSQKIQ